MANKHPSIGSITFQARLFQLEPQHCQQSEKTLHCFIRGLLDFEDFLVMNSESDISGSDDDGSLTQYQMKSQQRASSKATTTMEKSRTRTTRRTFPIVDSEDDEQIQSESQKSSEEEDVVHVGPIFYLQKSVKMLFPFFL